MYLVFNLFFRAEYQPENGGGMITEMAARTKGSHKGGIPS
jgi:hypothetical protein